MAAAGRKVPVTVLTGFLGSGKTTLLNHILRSPEHGMRFAIIENEFGEVGIDDKLVAKKNKHGSTEEIIEVMNGCICCTVRGDLVTALKRLYKRVKDFDAVLIETTGMADPAPVAQTFFVDDDIQEKFSLDGIVTVCDVKHLEQHLDEEKPEGAENESQEQLAFADRIILNKLDLLIESSTAPVAEGCTSAAAAAPTSGADAEALKAIPAVQARLAQLEARIRGINKTAQILYSCQSRVDPKQLLNLQAFNLDRVLEMDPEFLESDGTDHVHDDTVSSVAWKFPGFEVNSRLLDRWVGQDICQKLGTELYRYKGVLAVKGERRKLVFQGVHMLHSMNFIDEEFAEDGSDRECRFVFIGKYVKQRHAQTLEDGFLSCEAEKELRFKIGDLVMARTSAEGYELAKVLKQWDEGNCYRLELQNAEKTNVWGPIDDDMFVRTRTREEVMASLKR